MPLSESIGRIQGEQSRLQDQYHGWCYSLGVHGGACLEAADPNRERSLRGGENTLQFLEVAGCGVRRGMSLVPGENVSYIDNPVSVLPTACVFPEARENRIHWACRREYLVWLT